LWSRGEKRERKLESRNIAIYPLLLLLCSTRSLYESPILLFFAFFKPKNTHTYSEALMTLIQ
jgi:hypothetical protein